MTMTDPTEKLLDDLLGHARAREALPSDDLIARVLADAATVQNAADRGPVPTPAKGAWANLMEAIGGWPALSGLAAATVAGIWVGVAPPAMVSDVTAALIGDEVTVSFVSESDLLSFEGLIDG